MEQQNCEPDDELYDDVTDDADEEYPRELEEPLGGWVGNALTNDPDYGNRFGNLDQLDQHKSSKEKDNALGS